MSQRSLRKPIPVTLCITELAVGGAERCCAELARRLDRRRFKPSVISLGPAPADSEKSLIPRLKSDGIDVQCLNARGLMDTPRIIKALTGVLRAQQPKIVQTFLFHANILGRIAARRAGVPHVVSGIRVAEQRSRWYLTADRWTANLVDRHVCVSQAVADFSHTRGGLPREKLMVIGNGIDLNQYRNVTPLDLTSLGVTAGNQVAVAIGRLDPQKGLDWFLKALPRWLDRLPKMDVLLVGDGPERPLLEQLAESEALRGRVHFAGWRADVASILAASQVLILPSRWEGMPNVVLEAMAARRPVVATDVEGVRELLGDPATDSIAAAQVAALGSEDEFFTRLVALGGDQGLRTRCASANYLRVEQGFAIQAVVKSYEHLYETLVSRL